MNTTPSEPPPTKLDAHDQAQVAIRNALMGIFGFTEEKRREKAEKLHSNIRRAHKDAGIYLGLLIIAVWAGCWGLSAVGNDWPRKPMIFTNVVVWLSIAARFAIAFVAFCAMTFDAVKLEKRQ
ncbi:MAG TPA: hypothetical protein VEH27_00835 [Methylomirabilota bacterium]|nr:hypothetical protein [Methylomirabilota bacterium]